MARHGCKRHREHWRARKRTAQAMTQTLSSQARMRRNSALRRAQRRNETVYSDQPARRSATHLAVRVVDLEALADASDAERGGQTDGGDAVGLADRADLRDRHVDELAPGLVAERDAGLEDDASWRIGAGPDDDDVARQDAVHRKERVLTGALAVDVRILAVRRAASDPAHSVRKHGVFVAEERR